jgi:poly(3-hydroxybutyrate) depolymerase
MFLTAHRFRTITALTVVLLSRAALLDAQGSAIANGSSQFVFEHKSGPSERRITVWTYRPEGLAPNAPILFVLHGTRRDGERYRNQWQVYAERERALLLVPEFSAAAFPGRRNYSAPKPAANSMDSDDSTPSAFLAIDRIFDQVVSLSRLQTKQYRLYGHSAGAQFVHRYILFNSRNRVKVAVAANAGWYTMPDFEVAFPYGLKNSGIGEPGLKIALGQKLFVLLGEKDTDPRHPSLNRSTVAMRQGRERFERGQNFFRAAAQAAKQMNAPFLWEIATVPDADHDNAKMAVHAARLLFDN